MRISATSAAGRSRSAWLSLVLPALLLNYYGQGALVLANPDARRNPFYKLYPELGPGADAAPGDNRHGHRQPGGHHRRVLPDATSHAVGPPTAARHQPYVGSHVRPDLSTGINWMILVGVLLVVMRSARPAWRPRTACRLPRPWRSTADRLLRDVELWRGRLARRWSCCRRNPRAGVPLRQHPQGVRGRLGAAGAAGSVAWSWYVGARLPDARQATRKNEADIEWLVRKLEAKPPHRVPGTAVFLTGDRTRADSADAQPEAQSRHPRAQHYPCPSRRRRCRAFHVTSASPVDRVTDTFIRVVARYGFMETPSMPKILDDCRRKDLNVDIGGDVVFPVAAALEGHAKIRDAAWQDRLFMALARTSRTRRRTSRSPPTAWWKSERKCCVVQSFG